MEHSLFTWTLQGMVRDLDFLLSSPIVVLNKWIPRKAVKFIIQVIDSLSLNYAHVWLLKY